MANWLDSNRTEKCGNRNCGNQIAPGDYIYRKSPGVYLCGQCGMLAEAEPHLAGEVEEGVLADLAVLPPEASKTTIARTMIKLARMLDSDEASARDIGNLTKELRMNYMQLRELFPATEENDPTQAARDARERRAREMGG